MQDTEMQEATEELKAAQIMADNSTSKWRIDEAVYRMQAAKARINAIRFERGENQ